MANRPVMSLIVEVFAILSILGRLNPQSLVTIPIHLPFCILGIILLPTIGTQTVSPYQNIYFHSHSPCRDCGRRHRRCCVRLGHQDISSRPSEFRLRR